ncbi:MAG: TIGR03435 family protein [Bryobacteraceae bacterium]
MRAFTGIILFNILRVAALGQPTGIPAFDIASIKASAPATNPDTFASGGLLLSGRYDLRRATMLDLIRIAWGVDSERIVGGPNWLGFDRFDVSAKAPPSTPSATVSLMLRSLLEDRFQLVLHKDSRPLPAFVLTMAKGKPSLKEASGSAASGCQSQPQSGTAAYLEFSCRDITMGAFAGALRRMAGDYLPEPVVDSTGLEGSWDFNIRWNPRSRIVRAGTGRITIFDAIDNQLGLKLKLQYVSAPVIVLDHVNQEPTANPAGVTKILPPRSLEFEVATIGLSPPDERFGFRRYPGGRIELHAFPMKMLIGTAWDVDWDHMDERIAGAPKWADSRRFSIVAKASATPDGPQGTGFIDEDFQLMLRALLIERFKVATHLEDRPVPTYTLTAVRPKLRVADSSRRSNCREARVVAHDPRDVNPRLSRLIECRNITMAQFAQQLQTLDRVEAAFNKVVDETGLNGSWDFTLSFTPRSQLRDGAGAEAGQPAAADGSPGASDPNGAIPFMDAIRQQLGLKLGRRMRPMPVLVIDHIEETPADN